MMRLLLLVSFVLFVSAQDQSCLFGCVTDYVDCITSVTQNQNGLDLDDLCDCFGDYADCLDSCDGWCEIFNDAAAEFGLTQFQDSFCGNGNGGLGDDCVEAFCDAFVSCDGSSSSDDDDDGEVSLLYYEGIFCYFGEVGVCSLVDVVAALTTVTQASVELLDIAGNVCDVFDNYCLDNGGGTLSRKRGGVPVENHSVRFIAAGFPTEADLTASFRALEDAVDDGLVINENSMATNVDRTTCNSDDCSNQCDGCALNGNWYVDVEEDCNQFFGCPLDFAGDIELKTYVEYEGTNKLGEDLVLEITQEWDFGTIFGKCSSTQTGVYRFYSDANRCNRVVVDLDADTCEKSCDNTITDEVEDMVCNQNNLRIFLEEGTDALAWSGDCDTLTAGGINWDREEVASQDDDDSDSGSMLAPSFVLLLLAVAPFLQ